jgi:ubiquinone/menaquinone biosynthesis C-methylase UbiE
VDNDSGLADAFDRAARRYDLLTGLNPGYHRHLASAAESLADQLDGIAPELLDLGCGSGSSTAALLAVAPDATIVGVDASAGMLARASAKTWPGRVRFLHATAQQLACLQLDPVDGALAAYLFRNVPAAERDLVARAVRAQLRPGGWLVVQEYSVAGRRAAGLVWTLVCWAVVIPLATVVGGNPGLYVHLWRSVRAFDSTDRFARRLAEAGFTDIARHDVPGWQRGILHTFRARRPLAADVGPGAVPGMPAS